MLVIDQGRFLIAVRRADGGERMRTQRRATEGRAGTGDRTTLWAARFFGWNMSGATGAVHGFL
jgi:hypothetical protein